MKNNKMLIIICLFVLCLMPNIVKADYELDEPAKDVRIPIYVTLGTELYKDESVKEKLNVKVPADTVLYASKEYRINPVSSSYLVSYNGSKGWILVEGCDQAPCHEANAVIVNYNEINLKKKVNVYSDYQCTKKISSVDKSNIVAKYTNSIHFENGNLLDGVKEKLYVKYDGSKYGWIYISEDDFEINSNKIVNPDSDDTDPKNYTDKDVTSETNDEKNKKEDNEVKEEKDDNSMFFVGIGCGLGVSLLVGCICVFVTKKGNKKEVVSTDNNN